jgi:hypothetical protein
MTLARTSSALFVTFVLSFLPALRAAEKKDERVPVTLEELSENRMKYLNKMVSVEVTVPKLILVSEKGDEVSYLMEVSVKDDTLHLLCAGKPCCKEGDRIRVTGRFDLMAPTFARLRVDATAEGGKVEKLPPK